MQPKKNGEGKIKKFDNLSTGEYMVKSFKLKETQFGLRVYVEVDDFYLVLPARFFDKINSVQQLDELNENKFKMVYNGKNKDEFNKLMIDFIPLMDDATNNEDDGDTASEDDNRETDRKRKLVKRGAGASSSKVPKKKKSNM